MSGSRTADVSALDRDEEELLLIVGQAESPIGARMAMRRMRQNGAIRSEASVSRAFSRLDALGLTVLLGRKGRVLTERGQRHVTERLERNRRDAVFGRALDLRTVEEMLDWLKARRLLESEAAALAAERVTEEQLVELERCFDGHIEDLAVGSDPTPVALHFHVVLAQASASPVFEALIGSLYTPSLISVERALDVILSDRGTMGASVNEHREILAALRAKDRAAAGSAMSKHLMRLEAEARRFADEAAAGRFPDLLRIIDAVRSS